MSVLLAAITAVTSPSPSPSPSALPQIAHVVTSDRAPESITRTARTTYVVTAAQIAQDGDRTVADAIQNVPGVNFVRYGAFGAAVSFGIRGSSSQQVLVLVDGQPVAGAQIDNVNLEQLPVGNVDRIEIVEGGGSTLYGSGSIGGVINIITAPQPQRSTATLSTGSFGEQTYQFQTPYVSFQRTYAANDYSVVNAPNRQNAQAGLTAESVRYGHTLGAFDFALSADIADAMVGAPGELGYFSPTSEQSTVNRDLRLNVSHHGPRSTSILELGDSSQDLSYTCDTPADNNCPNSYYPTPPPGIPSNPPYAQLLYDQHWMASLRNIVGDARQRLVYGIDLMRGIARVDEGTGGGSPLAADNAPIVDAYAQTAAYVQAQWFGGNGDSFYAGLRGERDGGVGGAYSPSVGAVVNLLPPLALKLNAATAFRAPTAEGSLLSRVLESKPSAGTNARRRCDARRSDGLWIAKLWLVHDERIESDRLAAAGLHSGERRARVDSGADARREHAPVPRLYDDAQRDESLSRSRPGYAVAPSRPRAGLRRYAGIAVPSAGKEPLRRLQDICDDTGSAGAKRSVSCAGLCGLRTVDVHAG